MVVRQRPASREDGPRASVPGGAVVAVSVVGLLFGGFAVVLAIPVTSAVATLIDVLVLDHEPPAEASARNGAVSGGKG